MGVFEKVCVYIILTTVGTYYVGVTNNLNRRIKQHERTESSYFKKHVVLKVVHVKWYDSRVIAAKKEKEIKSIGAKKYLLKLKYRL